MPMYAAIVRRLVRRRFAELSAGDPSRIVAMFGPASRFRFVGDHVLGGELVGRAAIASWFDRMLGLFPGIAISPVTIVVAGWPWATTVTNCFRVAAALPNGSPYRNEGVQVMRLRFGRIVREELYEDTAALVAALAVIERERLAVR
jgi:ketosteroid isomerase-like protein